MATRKRKQWPTENETYRIYRNPNRTILQYGTRHPILSKFVVVVVVVDLLGNELNDEQRAIVERNESNLVFSSFEYTSILQSTCRPSHRIRFDQLDIWWKHELELFLYEMPEDIIGFWHDGDMPSARLNFDPMSDVGMTAAALCHCLAQNDMTAAAPLADLILETGIELPVEVELDASQRLAKTLWPGNRVQRRKAIRKIFSNPQKSDIEDIIIVAKSFEIWHQIWHQKMTNSSKD